MSAADTWMVRNMIIDILAKAIRPMMAKEIAAALRQNHGIAISKREVNQILYDELAKNQLVVNGDYEWGVPVGKPKPPPQVAQRHPNPAPQPAPPPDRSPQVVVPPATVTRTPTPSRTAAPTPETVPTTQAAATQTTSPEFPVGYIVAICATVVVFVIAAQRSKTGSPAPQYAVPYSANQPAVQYKKPPPTRDVSVRGYQRDDGTYVKPHYRTQQNGMPQDNFSSKGNVNPYTGKPGSQ